MSKTRNKKSKTPIYKNVGFYFILVYAILTIAFIAQLFIVNVLPMKFFAPVVIVLLLMLLGLYFLQMGKRMNKLNKTLGKVLIVILSLFLGVGNLYLYKTGSNLGKMSGNDTEVSVVSVVVMKDSKAKAIEDLQNSKFGINNSSNQDSLVKAVKDIEKDVKQDVTTVSYKSYKEFGDDLYSGKVDAIILDEGARGLFEDNHPKFSAETRVIKSYKYETKSKDTSKKVNVTEDSFSVYVTGIDSYGGISTVSRSDVNMVATVNPKTHQILLTSIPRDYYVAQPCQNNQVDKLTHTGIFGVSCTVNTAQNFLKTDINYYARVNFTSVVKIVDALGGITVNNPVAFTASDRTYSYNSGNIHLDGAKALRFARERYNLADGDRDRGRNQMRVITGIINKAVSPSIITKYAGIMDAIGDSFQTNMGNGDMSSLVKMQLNDMKGWNITQISISGAGKTAWSPANGFNSYVMEPNKATVNSATNLINKIKDGETITPAEVKTHEQLVSKAG